ncbi:SprB repeat-containing protein, partial [Flavobacterium seoulense]|uniref:SprB repeat-containing protein n=1 Tax=Flavobacterium seoulense TaxID=1492738 RepID=UPI00054F7128
METNLPSQKLKTTILSVFLLFFFSIIDGFSQDTFDGKYCPGPGAIGDEYATGIVFSQQILASPSSTCQIGTIRAKVDTQNQVLRLGMNIGNGGAALFRLYLDTDNNPLTGLTSDTFGGSLTVAGAEYIIEINSNASTFNLYSGNGSVKTPLAVNNGLAAQNGSATGCSSGGGSFLEFNIPFGSIGFNVCDVNNPGLINITKLASVSGNSDSSSRCTNTPLTFGIPLKGSVGPDATVCSGTNNNVLTVSGISSGSSIIKWQSSVSPFTTWTDIANTTTTYTATNLTQTTKYRAVFTNSGLCSGNNIATSEATITISPSPIVTINTFTNVSCFGGNNGQATASVTGGTANYSYSWNTNPVQTTATATNLAAGTYTVTVTDAKGCTDTEQITINQPAIAVSVSGIATNASCFGQADGSIAVTNSLGSTVVITNAQNQVVSNTGLAAGTYTLTATAPGGNNGQNCTATAQVVISQPAIAVSVSGIATNASCFGQADGSIAVTSSAGSTVVITNAQNQVVSNTGLPAGTYTLTATAPGGNNGQNCTATAQVIIQQPAIAVSVSGIATNASCFGQADGS